MSHEDTDLDRKWARRVLANPPAPSRVDWKAKGACGPVYRETGLDWWFGPDEDEASYTGTQIPKSDADQARAVCRTCPVRAECLLDAFRTDDQHGIRGGLTPYQRTRLSNQMAKAA